MCNDRAGVSVIIRQRGLARDGSAFADKASYAYNRLTAIPGVKSHFKARWFFNEFVLDLPKDAADVIGKLIEKGFAAGFPLSRYYPDMKNASSFA